MADLASVTDLAGMWRPLSADEQAVAANLLRVASAIVRSRVANVDARITAGTLDADLPRAVVVGMVRQVMINLGGYESRTIGTYTERFADAARFLVLPDEDAAQLAPAGSARGGVGSVKMRLG